MKLNLHEERNICTYLQADRSPRNTVVLTVNQFGDPRSVELSKGQMRQLAAWLMEQTR